MCDDAIWTDTKHFTKHIEMRYPKVSANIISARGPLLVTNQGTGTPLSILGELFVDISVNNGDNYGPTGSFFFNQLVKSSGQRTLEDDTVQCYSFEWSTDNQVNYMGTFPTMSSSGNLFHFQDSTFTSLFDESGHYLKSLEFEKEFQLRLFYKSACSSEYLNVWQKDWNFRYKGSGPNWSCQACSAFDDTDTDYPDTQPHNPEDGGIPVIHNGPQLWGGCP